MKQVITLPEDVLELMRRAKKELPGEFVAYPLDSGMTIEEFRQSLLERLERVHKPKADKLVDLND